MDDEKILTDYAYYSVLDHTGTFAASGYALSICPFTFVPKLKNRSYLDRVQWDFGDGTGSQSLCASHSYSFPGEYEVTLYVYASAGAAYTSSFSKTIKVKNFITDSISLSSSNSYIQTQSTTGSVSGINVIVNNSLPSYRTLSADGVTINMWASGSDDYFKTAEEYYGNKDSHLPPNYYFSKVYDNPYTDTTDTEVIDSMKLTDTQTIFARVSNNEVVVCDESDEGAVVAGAQSTGKFLFTSDIPSEPFIGPVSAREPVFGFVSLDTSKLDDGVSYNKGYYTNDLNRSNITYLNSLTTEFQLFTLLHDNVTQLTFSSNGIDGNGADDSTFDIPSIQYTNTRIPVTIRIKSDDGYPVKHLPKLTQATCPDENYEIRIVAISGNEELLVPAAQPEIFTSDSLETSKGGFWRGYVCFSGSYLSQNPDYALDNIRLSAYAVIDTTSTSWTESFVGGESNSFSVLDYNKYRVEKISESYDATELYKDLRYQEALQDDNIMFDEFIGSIVGNIESSPNTLGKRAHDKISDFVSNISDIDSCNIEALHSLYQMLDAEIDSFDAFNYASPPSVSRLMDIFSIKQSKLMPSRNQYNREFNTRGHSTGNSFYGINLGERITDIETYTVSASSPLVARSKFSSNFIYLNTDILSSYVSEYNETDETYPLSSFSTDWGWPLTLPNNATFRDVATLYEVYSYSLTSRNDQIEGILNWDESEYQTLTEETVSAQNWSGKDGIISEALRYSIMEGIGMISACSAQDINIVDCYEPYIPSMNSPVDLTESFP